MSAGAPTTFKIVQLNAENLFLFLDADSDLDWRTLSEKDWQKLSRATVANKPLIKTLWLADSLLHINADIICMNEVGGEESLSNFAKLFLKGRYRPHLIEGNSDRGIDIGFLVRDDFAAKVELRTHKHRPLKFSYPHEPGKTHYFSRDCAELRVHGRDPARPDLIALLVHLKSKLDPEGIDPGGRDRRQAEARLLTDIYTEVRGEFTPPVPVIVCGDFNGSAGRKALGEEVAEFAKTDLESVLEIAGVDGELAATQMQFSRGSGVQGMQIDFIFVSPELHQHLIHDQVGVYRYLSDLRVPLPLPKTLEQRTYLPSDHYPVVATFRNFISSSEA